MPHRYGLRELQVGGADVSDDFSDQIALVTGAGRGIGRGCAEALASRGAKVIAVARSANEVEELADRFPSRMDAWPLDATGEEILERIDAVDGLSILVNNAGGNRPQAFVDVDAAALDFMLDLNVRAAFRISQAAVRVMMRQSIRGSIVHMSSQMGHVGSPNRTAYCMTKHAIEGLTKAMAVELAPSGIRVNAVAPTFVETPMTKPMLDDPQFEEFVMSRIPLQRIASTDDVVKAVLYLASPDARMVTGHSLLVDGGWTAQ